MSLQVGPIETGTSPAPEEEKSETNISSENADLNITTPPLTDTNWQIAPHPPPSLGSPINLPPSPTGGDAGLSLPAADDNDATPGVSSNNNHDGGVETGASADAPLEVAERPKRRRRDSEGISPARKRARFNSEANLADDPPPPREGDGTEPGHDLQNSQEDQQPQPGTSIHSDGDAVMGSPSGSDTPPPPPSSIGNPPPQSSPPTGHIPPDVLAAMYTDYDAYAQSVQPRPGPPSGGNGMSESSPASNQSQLGQRNPDSSSRHQPAPSQLHLSFPGRAAPAQQQNRQLLPRPQIAHTSSSQFARDEIDAYLAHSKPPAAPRCISSDGGLVLPYGNVEYGPPPPNMMWNQPVVKPTAAPIGVSPDPLQRRRAAFGTGFPSINAGVSGVPAVLIRTPPIIYYPGLSISPGNPFPPVSSAGARLAPLLEPAAPAEPAEPAEPAAPAPLPHPPPPVRGIPPSDNSYPVASVVPPQTSTSPPRPPNTLPISTLASSAIRPCSPPRRPQLGRLPRYRSAPNLPPSSASPAPVVSNPSPPTTAPEGETGGLHENSTHLPTPATSGGEEGNNDITLETDKSYVSPTASTVRLSTKDLEEDDPMDA